MTPKRAFASPTFVVRSGWKIRFTNLAAVHPGPEETVRQSSRVHMVTYWATGALYPKDRCWTYLCPSWGCCCIAATCGLELKKQDEKSRMNVFFTRKNSFSTSSIHFCALKSLDSFQVCCYACIVCCLVHGWSLEGVPSASLVRFPSERSSFSAQPSEVAGSRSICSMSSRSYFRTRCQVSRLEIDGIERCETKAVKGERLWFGPFLVIQKKVPNMALWVLDVSWHFSFSSS